VTLKQNGDKLPWHGKPMGKPRYKDAKEKVFA
jgi:hypothetical protein